MIPLDIAVEDVLRFTLSAGVLTPDAAEEIALELSETQQQAIPDQETSSGKGGCP